MFHITPENAQYVELMVWSIALFAGFVWSSVAEQARFDADHQAHLRKIEAIRAGR